MAVRSPNVYVASLSRRSTRSLPQRSSLAQAAFLDALRPTPIPWCRVDPPVRTSRMCRGRRLVRSGRSIVGVCAQPGTISVRIVDIPRCARATALSMSATGVTSPHVNSTGLLTERSSSSVGRRGTQPAGRKSRKTLRRTANSLSNDRRPFPRKRARRSSPRSVRSTAPRIISQSNRGLGRTRMPDGFDGGDAGESHRRPYSLLQCDPRADGKPDDVSPFDVECVEQLIEPSGELRPSAHWTVVHAQTSITDRVHRELGMRERQVPRRSAATTRTSSMRQRAARPAIQSLRRTH